MLTAISAIFVFLTVILVHEFGHFAVAKLVGIKVNEFSIGMGPKLLQRRKGETEYTFRLLPIGGYVKMDGEDESSDNPRSFNNAHVLSRIGVLLAGATMNFILAIVTLTIVSYGLGVATTSVEIRDGLPAEKSGMISGDTIVSINNNPTNDWPSIVEYINNSDPSKDIEVKVKRENQEKTFFIKPTIENDKIVIGIESVVEKSLTSAIKGGFEKTRVFLGAMFEFIRMLFRGQVGIDSLAGPVGVIKEVGVFAKQGIYDLLFFLGFISINLGFLNLLPIPALDGSRIVFLLVELVRGKPIDPEKEGFVHFLGFIFLISLMLIVTYKDILRLNFF
ncbi:MAG TPA: RIP metalloprotease RseP [Tissierellaceae bacterium]|nr:RIP metalloprotease RseP [Tissierellaceae bacterium]